ncbi:MAG: trypsin-like serine protease [Ideonella sp.]|nr:trypsin-like serine protease [Ideonella sp.]
MRSLPRLLATAAAAWVLTGAAWAAPATLPHELRAYSFASPEQVAQGRGEVIASHTVEAAGAPWVRLQFKDVRLLPGSKLRITSLQDGAVQELDARGLHQWRNTSAYFNGEAVRVELLAGKGTKGNRFAVSQVMVGQAPVQTESQCGPTDDRVPSNAPDRARLVNVGCTVNLMSNGCFITAGHCLSSPGSVNVVEFNVPPSNSNGSIVHPAPKDQYVPTTNRVFRNGGVGRDWGVFTTSPNATTGLTALQAQGSSLNFATTVPVVGAEVVITGYGVDSGAANQTQQVSNGPIVNVNTTATSLQYKSDTEGGNSGSAVLSGGNVVAIHSHGGCTTGNTGGNQGTLYTNPDLQAAFTQVCGATPNPPTCSSIRSVKAACSAKGKLTVNVRLTDTSHDGQAVVLAVDGASQEAPINGDVAKVVLKKQASGNHTYELIDPEGCVAPKTVVCP